MSGMMGGMSGNPTAMQNYAAWYGLNALNKIDTSAVDNANQNMAKYGEQMSQNLGNRPDYVYSVNGSDAARQRAEQAYYNSMVDNFQPQFDQRRADLETRLANQGLSVGSEAYQRAMNDLEKEQNQALTNASNQAVLSGQNAFSQSLADAISSGNFTNTARQMPIQEILTLLSNSPSGYDIAMDKYSILGNYANTAAQQKAQAQASKNNFWNGLINAGVTAAGMYFGGPAGAAAGKKAAETITGG